MIISEISLKLYDIFRNIIKFIIEIIESIMIVSEILLKL